jgi:hypothetical protein
VVALKTAASDSLPPQRTSPGEFYPVTAGVEFLQQPNIVVDVVGGASSASGLDSLYEVSGGDLPAARDGHHNIAMTYAHGPDLPQGFVFTGFDLWSFRRADCQAIVDFVLRRIWNVPRRASMTATIRR